MSNNMKSLPNSGSALSDKIHYRSFLSNFLLHLRYIFKYQGREDRKVYWLFSMAEFIFMIGFATFWLYIFFLIGNPSADYSYQGYKEQEGLLQAWFGVGVFVLLSFFLVNLAASARRLRDAGRSTLWLILVFIPLFNFLLLPFLCLPSKDDPQAYPGDHL